MGGRHSTCEEREHPLRSPLRLAKEEHSRLSDAESETVWETSSPGEPIVLGLQPTTATLRSADPNRLLSVRLREMAPDRRFFLILDQLRADKQPGVLYAVFLDLPETETSSPDQAHFAGVLNFYSATKGAHLGGGPSESFEVTLLLRDLAARKKLRRPTVITIIPQGRPEPGATPSIERVELIETHW
jgi:hypothetical protein